MPVREILLLGNPRLLAPCAPVALSESDLAAARQVGQDLQDTLLDFRARHGWGRAIAAPQIGVLQRLVFVQVDRPWLLLNPRMLEPSTEKIELWDDCMSFPDLLVRLHRHRRFELHYHDDNGQEHHVGIDGLLSELLQHELDHLDGILAVARALDGASFALQSQRAHLPGSAFANPHAGSRTLPRYPDAGELRS